MALPTYDSAGTAVTTGVPACPATVNAGDLLVMVSCHKYPGTTLINTPSGWTAPTNAAATGGAGASGVDTGDVRVTVFTREADGTEGGTTVTLTYTGGTPNAQRNQIFRLTKTAGSGWDIAAANGTDTSSDVVWSVTAGADPGITVDDLLMICAGVNSDVDFTLVAATATSAVLGTVTERSDAKTAAGDDLGFDVATVPVTAGTASAPPATTATLTGAAAGAAVFLRLREIHLGTASITLGAATLSATGTVVGDVGGGTPVPHEGAGFASWTGWSGWS